MTKEIDDCPHWHIIQKLAYSRNLEYGIMNILQS